MPTELGEFQAFRIFGTWAFTMSNSCAPGPLEAQIGQFDPGTQSDTVRLIGSWQVVGAPASLDIGGWVLRSTGVVRIELSATRTMDGIFLDNENAALAYADGAGCASRVRGTRIE